MKISCEAFRAIPNELRGSIMKPLVAALGGEVGDRLLESLGGLKIEMTWDWAKMELRRRG